MTARFEQYLALVNERLDHLGSLRPGWLNGDGAVIATDTLTRARILLEQLFHLDVQRPRIYPTPDGGIQMEWTRHPYETSLRLGPDSSIYGIRVNVDSGECTQKNFRYDDRAASIAELVVVATP